MKYINRLLFQSKSDIRKDAYVWNMIAGLLSATESVIFSIIVVNLSGLNDAGIISIGYAIGNLMATVGKYGVRTFQVTDVYRKYDFSNYLYTRIITTVMMIFVGTIYITIKAYDPYKWIVVMLVCSRFVLEAFEDVFGGACQREGRLDIASKIVVFRSICYIVLCSTAIFITKNMILSLAIGLVSTFLFDLFVLVNVVSEMQFIVDSINIKSVWQILKSCTPLFMSAFFFFYITNAPKYAIDSVMNDEVQACYGFISYPVFAIELLNNFIYQPALVDLANEWCANDLKSVRKRIGKQLFIVFILTMLALIIGFFLGIPILSLLFSTDLSGYKIEMLILLLGGGILAAIGYLSTILVTMRQSMLMIYGYVVLFGISVFAYSAVIKRFSVIGGVILYCCLCVLFVMYEFLCIRFHVKKRERLKNICEVKDVLS